MSDHYHYPVDIRFAVFIIWALLFLIFIAFPITIIYIDILVRRVCLLFGCRCGICGNTAQEDVVVERGIYYPFLSSRQKLELKRLRTDIIKKCLQRYSVWIVIEKNTVFVKEEPTKPNDFADNESGKTTVEVDVKSELLQSVKTQCTEETEPDCFDDEEENTQYTHIYISHPGYDIDGIHASALSSANKKRIEHSETKSRFNSVYHFWKRKKKNASLEPESEIQPNHVIRLEEKRTASKFCAICLASYQPHDKISWSSNEGCSHAFHSECILTWLSTLGDKASRNQRFTENLEHDELLRYSLECPCCRQDFVSKDIICLCCESEEDEETMVVEMPALNVSEHSV